MSTDSNSNSEERPPSSAEVVVKDKKEDAVSSSDKGSEKDSASGDEAIIAMKVDGEVTDRAIVEVGRTRPQYQYSREELMRIKTLPLSKKRPDCLNAAILNNTRGNWNPDCWRVERRRSETPEEDLRLSTSRSTDGDNHQKRRSGGDPRERLRKEQDGIVLSPQRRSFNSGCFVSVNQVNSKRPDSPPGKPEITHREPPVRRIGSGRILTRDMWDFRSEGADKHEPEYSFRGPGGPPPPRDRDREPPSHRGDRSSLPHRGDDRHDLHDSHRAHHRGAPPPERFDGRRAYGRAGDYNQLDRGGGNDRMEGLRGNHRNNSGYGVDRRGGNQMGGGGRYDQEEPEWFSGGPTSQADTIELKGFDDISEEGGKDSKAKGKDSGNGNLTKNAKKKLRRNAEKAGVDKDEKVDKIEKSSEDKENQRSKDNNNQLQPDKGPKGRSTPTNMVPINAEAMPPQTSPISGRVETRKSPKGGKEGGKRIKDKKEADGESMVSSSGQNKSGQPDFNLDEFLKSDMLPEVQGFISNGTTGTESVGSRFSQWFTKRESPTQILESRGASLQDELLNGLLNDAIEPKAPSTHSSRANAYFAPINPANNNNSNNTMLQGSGGGGIKLLEMLQRNNKKPQNCQSDTTSEQNLPKDKVTVHKKLMSLEELETQMMGGPRPPQNEANKPEKQSETDLAAFKKLLAQVSGGQAVSASNGPIPHKSGPSQGPPMTLMQLLHSQMKNPQQSQAPNFHQNLEQQQQQQQQQMPTSFNHIGPLGPVQHPHQTQVQHENLMKVLQIQQQQKQRQQQQQQNQMMSMMMNQQRMGGGMSPVPPDVQMMVNNTPSARELLQRPEAAAIIRGLQQGEITRQHLMQQLQNPAMQHRHRDVLVSILKYYDGPGSGARNNSPHANLPGPQDQMLQQMLYQQRIPSPMSNVMPTHRVPSPRELVAHNQSIFQNALLKKKLEEQQENYRKKKQQQQQQGQQFQQQRPPSPVNSPVKQMLSSPTPLAFTPTSVLRKMTAEKEPEGCLESSSTKLANPSQGVHLQMQSNVQMISQGVVSRHSNFPSQPVPANWPNPTVKQHPGRPIVKGTGTSNQMQYGSQQPQQQQQPNQQQQVFGTNAGRSKFDQLAQRANPQFPMGQQASQMPNPMKQMPSQFPGTQQQSVKPQIPQVGNQTFSSTRTVIHQQMSMTVGRQNSPGVAGFLSGSGGDLSPTSNQLARWFSPELLAQARTVKLPELGSSNVLSLEELERLQHASTTVHN